MLRLVATFVAFFVISGFTGGVAGAKQCRDSHGKFIKCPAPAPKQCRDASGKFTKCPPKKS